MRPPETGPGRVSELLVRRRGLLFLGEQVTHTTRGGGARDVKIGDIVNKLIWNLNGGKVP